MCGSRPRFCDKMDSRFAFQPTIIVRRMCIVRGEIEVVVEIETLRIRNTRGVVKVQDRRRASRIVRSNAEFLLEEWRQIHG
jgi:hypothetical protein